MRSMTSSGYSAPLRKGLQVSLGTFVKTTVVLTLLLVASACDTTPQRSTEERVKADISKKLEGWTARRNSICRTAALEVAIGRADSMILEYAREQKLVLERPSRPVRPEEPALRRPNDTLKLEPFLGDTL